MLPVPTTTRRYRSTDGRPRQLTQLTVDGDFGGGLQGHTRTDHVASSEADRSHTMRAKNRIGKDLGWCVMERPHSTVEAAGSKPSLGRHIKRAMETGGGRGRSTAGTGWRPAVRLVKFQRSDIVRWHQPRYIPGLQSPLCRLLGL